MNRILLLCLIVPAFLAAARGADAPPEPPLVARLPASAAWTAAFSLPPNAAPPPGRFLKETRFGKMKADRQEVSVWSDGTATEKWLYKGMLLFDQPEDADIHILSAAEAHGPLRGAFPDLSVSDFPELNWIAPAAYVDTRAYRQHTCHYYQGTGADGRACQAWIDSQSRLPVAAVNGTETIVYAIGDPPATPPALPKRFAEELKKYQDAADEPDRHRMKL